jgi:sigma-E factor negative regulatory protein RseA
MTEKINEQVSAFVDGELLPEESALLYRRMSGDDELRSTWQRYHLIRDAMREDMPIFVNNDSIIDKLDDATEQDSAEVLPAAASTKGRILKPVAGLAIAASVAMVAIVGVLNNTDQLSQEPVTQVAAVPSQPAFRPETYQAIPRSSWDSAKPAVVSHLNNYLVDHSAYAGQGIISYARIAGYDEPVTDRDLNNNESDKSENDQQ